MTPAAQRPPLLPFNPDAIPAALREHRRFAPYRAPWDDKRGKYDKVPCLANGYGLSTARPERWMSFDAAVSAWRARPDLFAGVGYLMTGPHGIVGIDLDRCVAGGQLEPWAQELITQLASYAEISPSGTGARVMAACDIPADWTNHERGIEVYAGHEPRFLTLTGQHLPDTPIGVCRPDPEVLAGLGARYARERSAPGAGVISLQMPEVLDELLLPDLGALNLPWAAREFLEEGKDRGDRSRELFASAVALFGAGLGDAEVFSVLATSPHAYGIALDHRRQDPDRALLYLWLHHVRKAKDRGSAVATADDFEDVGATGGRDAPPGDAPPGAAGAAPTRKRFAFSQWAQYTQRKPVEWLVKGVLPKAEIGALFGASGAGKSFFALDLLAAVARGVEWRGRTVRQGAVAYVCAEGAGGFARRMEAYSEYHGIEEPQHLPFYVLGDSPNLMERTDVRDLQDGLRDLPPVSVIVVDTLAQTTPGANENSGEDMGRALGHCRALHKATGAMVLLIGHAGKDADRGMRGWSGIKGALDVEILVERDGQRRAATITKLKDGEGEGEEFAFHLHGVQVGEDDAGDAITSCVALPGPADGAAPLTRGRSAAKGAVQQVVMRVATALTDLPGTTTVTALVEASIAEIEPPEGGKRDQRRKDVIRAILSLTQNGAISTDGGEVTLR